MEQNSETYTLDIDSKISEFCKLLLEANKSTNLISKNDEKKIMTRHVADSLIFANFYALIESGEWRVKSDANLMAKEQTSLLLNTKSGNNSQLSTTILRTSQAESSDVHQLLSQRYGSLNSQLIKWADIGSGAGFPVIPLCIHFPQTKFYAIECRKKRCDFLDMVKQKLGLQNVEIIRSRAETCGLKNVDVVSCRAVGSLKEDYERAKMLLKKGGHFLTVKSKRIFEEESELLKRAKIMHYRLPQEEMEYVLICLS